MCRYGGLATASETIDDRDYCVQSGIDGVVLDARLHRCVTRRPVCRWSTNCFERRRTRQSCDIFESARMILNTIVFVFGFRLFCSFVCSGLGAFINHSGRHANVALNCIFERGAEQVTAVLKHPTMFFCSPLLVLARVLRARYRCLSSQSGASSAASSCWPTTVACSSDRNRGRISSQAATTTTPTATRTTIMMLTNWPTTKGFRRHCTRRSVANCLRGYRCR